MNDRRPQDASDRCDGIPAAAVSGSIGERFAEVARRWPERTAVDVGSDSLTYAELADRAHRVSHHVASAAEGEPLRIGFLFDQPLRLLPSIMGVLQAGSVYVPIDPSFPAARIATVLEDAGLGMILCDDRTAEFARRIVPAALPVIEVGSLAAAPDGIHAPAKVDPGAVASLFYTSGSGGTPKGVIQNHRNLIHYARCYVDTLRMRPSDRVSLLFSYSFSASIPDIFGTLLCGATLCPFDVKRNGPAALARWLGEDEISLLHLVPSLFRHLLEQLPADAGFPALRAIDLGGEAVTAADVAAFRRAFADDCVLVHRLAATECSLISRHVVASDAAVSGGVLPIGSPVEDMQIALVDSNGEEVEPGTVGEIVLRSPYLSLGYWRRPELTDSVFAVDPTEPAIRVYRTGDVGRRRADGLIEHLGRGDQRVKVRGFTVELTEVEAALRADARVRECAVVARTAPGRDTFLVAFVRTRPGEDFGVSEMRRLLLRTLPEYALPSRLQHVEELPMTATGKIDRRRLALDGIPDRAHDKEFIAPRNPIEASLAAIWSEELGLEALSVSDDYFALGGTSLQAVQIMARIEEQFGRDLAPSILLEAPTVAALADRLERDELPAGGSLAVALKGDGSRPPLFCFPGIGGEPIVFKAFVRHLHPDQPCYGIQHPSLVGSRRPSEDLADYAGPQVEAIRSLRPHGPYHLVGYSFGSTLAFEVARRLRAAGEPVATLVLIDGPAPGHPKLRSDVPALHQALDRWLGPGLKEGQRTTPVRILYETLKARGRDLECRLRELAGQSLTRVQRRRRRKRASLRARNRYRPVAIDAPIRLVRSTDSHHAAIFERDPHLGWQALTPYPVEVRSAPGSHAGLFDEPAVAAVAAAVNEALDEARARAEAGEAIRPREA